MPRKRSTSDYSYTIVRFLVIVSICLMVSSCATGPLNTAEKRSRIAESIGFRSNGPPLMYNCFFEEVQGLDSKKKVRGVRGVVAMTDSEFCLMDGAFPTNPRRHFIKIPLSEIEGVHSSSTQVHVKHQDKLYALVAFDWDDFRANYSQTQRVFRALVAANVPVFQTDRYYSWAMLRSTGGFGYRSSDNRLNNPPTNLEDSVQAHHSRERDRLEKQMQPFQ